LVADVEHDLLRVERLAGRERGAVVRAAPALRTGVPIEQLLPREIAEGGRAEGLLVLDVVDELERAARTRGAEVDIRQRCDDVQMLRPRQVDGEGEDRHDVRPPRTREQRGRAVAAVDILEEPGERWRRDARFELPRR